METRQIKKVKIGKKILSQLTNKFELYTNYKVDRRKFRKAIQMAESPIREAGTIFDRMSKATPFGRYGEYIMIMPIKVNKVFLSKDSKIYYPSETDNTIYINGIIENMLRLMRVNFIAAKGSRVEELLGVIRKHFDVFKEIYEDDKQMHTIIAEVSSIVSYMKEIEDKDGILLLSNKSVNTVLSDVLQLRELDVKYKEPNTLKELMKSISKRVGVKITREEINSIVDDIEINSNTMEYIASMQTNWEEHIASIQQAVNENLRRTLDTEMESHLVSTPGGIRWTIGG